MDFNRLFLAVLKSALNQVWPEDITITRFTNRINLFLAQCRNNVFLKGQPNFSIFLVVSGLIQLKSAIVSFIHVMDQTKLEAGLTRRNFWRFANPNFHWSWYFFVHSLLKFSVEFGLINGTVNKNAVKQCALFNCGITQSMLGFIQQQPGNAKVC